MTRNVYGRGYELLSRSTDQNLEGKTYYHTDLYGSPFMAVDTEGSSNWHAEQEMLSAEESRAREAEDTSMEEEVEAGVTVAVTGSALGMNPKDARYGAGQYLPDIKPNSQTSASLGKH